MWNWMRHPANLTGPKILIKTGCTKSDLDGSQRENVIAAMLVNHCTLVQYIQVELHSIHVNRTSAENQGKFRVVPTCGI